MVHLKYPSMERQDLTQSQLGSFKFAPVDEAPRDSPHPHPLFMSRYAFDFQNDGSSDRGHNSSQMAFDPPFFNHQIKPSLDSSRLRLGPAAVRAAVESASFSPQKQFNHRHPRDNMRPNVSQNHMHPYVGRYS